MLYLIFDFANFHNLNHIWNRVRDWKVLENIHVKISLRQKINRRSSGEWNHPIAKEQIIEGLLGIIKQEVLQKTLKICWNVERRRWKNLDKMNKSTEWILETYARIGHLAEQWKTLYSSALHHLISLHQIEVDRVKLQCTGGIGDDHNITVTCSRVFQNHNFITVKTSTTNSTKL